MNYAQFQARLKQYPTIARPCKAPGEPVCAACHLFTPATPPTTPPLDLRAMLAGHATPEPWVSPGVCGRLLETPSHKYQRKGANDGCGRCGTLPSHVIHTNGMYWQGKRGMLGYES